MNKVSKFLSVYTILAVLLMAFAPLSVSAAKKSSLGEKAPPLTYEECVDRYGKVKDRNKFSEAIKNAAQNRTNKLGEVVKLIESKKNKAVSEQHRQDLIESLNAGISKINQQKDAVRSAGDTKQLAASYCGIKFEARFRVQQVNAVVKSDTVAYFDEKLTYVLNHQANQPNNISGPLSSEINAKLAEARSKVESTDSKQIQASTEAILNSSSLAGLNEYYDRGNLASSIVALKKAAKNHTESWILRKASTAVGNTDDKSVELTSIQILTKDDQPVEKTAKKTSQLTGINREQQNFGVDTVTIDGVVYTSSANFSSAVQQNANKNSWACFKLNGGGQDIMCGEKSGFYDLGSSVRDDSRSKTKSSICYRVSSVKLGTDYMCGKPSGFYNGKEGYSIRIVNPQEYARYLSQARAFEQAQQGDTGSGSGGAKAIVKINVDGKPQTINLQRNPKTLVWEVK